jgi:hypothetical protein
MQTSLDPSSISSRAFLIAAAAESRLRDNAPCDPLCGLVKPLGGKGDRGHAASMLRTLVASYGVSFAVTNPRCSSSAYISRDDSRGRCLLSSLAAPTSLWFAFGI